MADPAIYPCLTYNDPRAAMAFLEAALGFETLGCHEGPDHSIQHAEMALGRAGIMLGPARAEAGWVSPRDLPAVNMTVYLAVDDLDASYQRARAAGAELTRPLADTSYGSREFGLRDPEGHHWFIGTYRPKD
jgi:uncharacterized glyoxalase superfamily protein PhnB